MPCSPKNSGVLLVLSDDRPIDHILLDMLDLVAQDSARDRAQTGGVIRSANEHRPRISVAHAIDYCRGQPPVNKPNGKRSFHLVNSPHGRVCLATPKKTSDLAGHGRHELNVQRTQAR